MRKNDETALIGFILGLAVATFVWALVVTFWPGHISVKEFEDTSAVICWEDTTLVRDAETQEWRSAINLEINLCRR